MPIATWKAPRNTIIVPEFQRPQTSFSLQIRFFPCGFYNLPSGNDVTVDFRTYLQSYVKAAVSYYNCGKDEIKCLCEFVDIYLLHIRL